MLQEKKFKNSSTCTLILLGSQSDVFYLTGLPEKNNNEVIRFTMKSNKYGKNTEAKT
jgi:hypothetical protein